MPKTFTLLLGTAPYQSQNSQTAARLAGQALALGHTVNLIASGDGIYNFLTGQKAKKYPNAEEEFGALIRQGLRVYL
ncbi:MAG: DsrE family protein [Nitrospinae bacterium]|nr:DsrE family protein [Nitrospinota bacterium]